MAALDEFLIGACLTERPLSRLPWESSDGEKTENLERDNGFTEHQPVKVVAEKAWNDWSSDTKQLEEHSSYGIKGQSNVDDGSIVSKRFGDEIMAKVILGELSTTEIVYGHGYKAKSEPKQPVDEKKIVDLGFEAAFTRGNLDTSYSLQSEIYNTPSFLRETSNSAKSAKKPSFLDSTGLSNSKSFSPTKSTAKDNARRFIELPKTSKVNMPKMPSTNEIVDVGLDQLGPSISKMINEPNNQSGLSINSYSDAKISATFSKQTTMPWDESRWEAKHTKSTDFHNADFQKGKLNSASSCFDKATSLSAFERPQSTIGNDQAFDEYKPFKPDIKASFYNNIDFANPSTDVGYAPSFSNIGTSNTKKTGINKRSFSDSNYFGEKKTSHSISSKYTGRIPNLKSESYISSSDLRNECKKTADQRVEPGYSRPPAVDTSCFKLPTPSYSNTQYDTCKNTTYPSVEPDYSKLPVVETSCFKLSTPSYSNTQYDTCKNTTDPSVEPGYSKLPVVDTSCFKLPTPSYSNTQYDTCENTTYPSVEPGYSKPPAVDSSCFKLSTPSYSNTQYAKKSDSNIEHKYYSNPSHTTKTTQQEVARSDIAPIKQQSSMSETMEMKDTHLTYGEYKLFRPEIKASFENNIDYVYPSTDVGYAPSFSNSDTFDTKKTAINKQSFSDSNYFETKKPSHSILSTYTGIIPYLKSDPSISSKDLRNTCKNTTYPSAEPYYSKPPVVDTSCFKLSTPSYSNTQYDTCENTTYPSVEPGYSKPPAVDSSCFKLSTPSYSNTQYAKKSDSNIEHKYYSNPSHTTKTTQQEVARSDIAPIKQQSSMSETMEMKDTHLTYGEYKLFRPEIKASFENNIDYVYPSTDVGYAPSFSNSDTFDTKKTAINKQSFSDSNYFETKKPSHSILSTYTGIIPFLKSDPSISSKDLRNTCKNTTYPSAEPYYSKPPGVDTSCFKLSTPSYTNSRYDTCKNTMDPSVEPCYSQPPVVDTACFRLATPSYTNTQYVKGSDRNIEQKYYSNPSHTTKATHQKVTRPDIIPTQQPSSNSEKMKIEDVNLSHDEYKPFEPDIKASFENNNDYANDITDVGYAPLLSDSVMSDNKIADTYIHSVTDRKPFGVNKMNQSNSLAFTNRVQIVKSESLTSDNDLKIACNIVPSLEHCYSEHPDVITTSFRLPSPSCSSTQYDKRSDQIFTTRCSSNPTHTTKTTPEVVIRPDNVSAKQPKSMSVTLDESKRASKCSNQSRSVASVQNVFTERNIGNAVGNTVSVKGSETSINQRSNPPIGSNSIKSWLVKSIESEDDSSEFETETATHNTPVAYNRLNEDILRTSDIETKQIGFKSNNKDVKSSYVNAKAEDVKPKVFKSNTIIVPPASVKTGITIVKTRADTCGIKSLDLIKKVKTVKPATVGAEEYAPLRYQSKSHDQHPISNSYSTTPNTLTVNAGHKVGLPKVSKVIVVEPEHVKRERRKKKIERMVEMIPIDIDDNMVSKQYLSDTESNTLSDDCMPVRTRMEDVRKQYISDGDDDTYDMNEDTSSWGFKKENNDHIDNNINDTYKQIMKTIKNLGCQKETKTSCPKSVKCGTKLCAAKKKISFAKLDELPNTHSMNDLCKRCKKELSQSHSKSHSTKNKPAVKMINTDNKELEVPTQQLEGHRNAPIPSEVYYQLIDIVERNIGAEQKRSLMRSTSIAGLLERMNSYNVEHEINDMADHEDPALTEENIDSLVKKNELKTKHRTRYNSVEGMAGANETVSCLSGLSELNYNTDVSYGHGTEHDKTNRDCRKISKGRNIINFMKSLFCCKRKNKAFDVDD